MDSQYSMMTRQHAPSTLEIIAVSQAAAGDETLSITSGQAVRIMTGAPIPSGADAIIPIEACSINGHQVTLNQPSKPHLFESVEKTSVKMKLVSRKEPISLLKQFPCVRQWVMRPYLSFGD